MKAFESCPKHNMIAYLEKIDGNTEFHEIMDFLTRSSIYYALTVSTVVSTTFVEQFWMSAKYKTINNVRYITATVAGKPVTILRASIRSDLLFDDADGIDTLNNQAIFDTIQLMGLKNVPVPLDYFPINPLTSKVLSFMVKKGKNFSGNVTPLFDSMLVQPTEGEGEASERPSESQPIPSPPHLKGSGGNHGECFHEDKICRKEIYAEKVDAEGVYYMETEDAHNEKGVSTEDQVNTVKPDEATPTVFGDDETIAEFLVSMSQNKARQKGVEIKDVEDSNRPRPTSTRSLLTLKPLPKIDPKDKGKKVLEEEAESDAESEGVNEAERKFAQLANDEEIARKVQEEWETEEKNKKLAEEEDTKVALICGWFRHLYLRNRSEEPYMRLL
ncbi:hypothetical protein Tco_1430078 [Tanacetum coccineum]